MLPHFNFKAVMFCTLHHSASVIPMAQEHIKKKICKHMFKLGSILG